MGRYSARELAMRMTEEQPTHPCVEVWDRTRLDRSNYRLGRFETEAGDGGSIVIKARFDDDDMAERFRQEFQGKLRRLSGRTAGKTGYHSRMPYTHNVG